MQFYNWSRYEIKVIFKWAEINKTNSWVLHSGDYAYYLSPARLTLVSADVARAALEFENVYWAGLSTEGLKQIHSYYFIFSKTKYLICLFRLVHTTTCIYFGERQKQSSFYKASTLGRTLKNSYFLIITINTVVQMLREPQYYSWRSTHHISPICSSFHS